MPSYIQNSTASTPAVVVEGAVERKAPSQLAAASNELGFVLDRSDSMESMADSAIAGFNTLLGEQQQTNPQTSFSLTLFNDSASNLYDALPVAEVPFLSRTLYEPSGGTALNDAIGSMIQQIGKRVKRSTRVLIAILTDGFENSSRSFSRDDILHMVTYRRTTYNWKFIFYLYPPCLNSLH